MRYFLTLIGGIGVLVIAGVIGLFVVLSSDWNVATQVTEETLLAYLPELDSEELAKRSIPEMAEVVRSEEWDGFEEQLTTFFGDFEELTTEIGCSQVQRQFTNKGSYTVAVCGGDASFKRAKVRINVTSLKRKEWGVTYLKFDLIEEKPLYVQVNPLVAEAGIPPKAYIVSFSLPTGDTRHRGSDD